MPLDQKSPVPWWYRARYFSGVPGRIRKLPPRGKLVARVSTVRIRRAQHGLQGTDRTLGERRLSRRRKDAIDRGRRTTALGDPAREAPPGNHGGAMATTGSHRAKPLGERGRCERRRTKRGPGERCQGAAARTAPCVAGPAHKRDPSAARPIVMAVLRWKPV